jgi:hypothetical protein
MMMWKIIAVLFLAQCLLPTGFAFAQNASQTVPSSVSSTIEQVVPNANPRFVLVSREQSLFGSDPFLQQFGVPGALSGNAASIVQEGDGNVTLLRQYGGLNVASIQLDGDDNVVDARQLYGNNALGLSIQGDGNTIPVRQYNLLGRGNELSLELVGVSGLDLPAPITQIGGGIPIHIQIRSGTP